MFVAEQQKPRLNKNQLQVLKKNFKNKKSSRALTNHNRAGLKPAEGGANSGFAHPLVACGIMDKHLLQVLVKDNLNETSQKTKLETTVQQAKGRGLHKPRLHGGHFVSRTAAAATITAAVVVVVVVVVVATG